MWQWLHLADLLYSGTNPTANKNKNKNKRSQTIFLEKWDVQISWDAQTALLHQLERNYIPNREKYLDNILVQ
jgi:hypothetical protein